MKKLLSLLLALTFLWACVPASAEDALSLDSLMEGIETFDETVDPVETVPPEEEEMTKDTLDVSVLNSIGLTMAEIEADDAKKNLAIAGLIYAADKRLNLELTTDAFLIIDSGHFNSAKDRVDVIIYNSIAFYPKVISISWTPGENSASGGFTVYDSNYYTTHWGSFWYSAWRSAASSNSKLESQYQQIRDLEQSLTTPTPTPEPTPTARTALTVGKVTWESSEDRQSIYLDKPAISGGSGKYTIAYNIYDSNSNPVNYFYSDEDRVAATPGYGGLFNVFIVVTDLETGESDTQNIGWQELVWPYAARLTVGKAAFEISPDGCSIFLTRPSIACKSGSVTIAYNIYDAQSNPVNYFYSADTRVAATPGYAGKFNVFIVVTDTGTGESDTQNIGWQVLGGPEPTATPTPTPVPQPLTWYPAGTYTVGVDIPAGDYVLKADDDSTKCYFCVRSGSSSGSITYNDNFYFNQIINLRAGDWVELKRCSATEMNAFYNNGWRQETEWFYGMFRIGYDFAPGTYLLEQDSVRSDKDETSYFAIYSTNRQTGSGAIVQNDNWKRRRYITVQEGQYLYLSYCRVAPVDNGFTLTEYLGIGAWQEGQYLVGTDIPAGNFILPAIEEGRSGYFTVTSDANGDDIIYNDNFDVNQIIEIRDGEYVSISRCVAVPMDAFYAQYKVSTQQNGGMFRVGYDIEPGTYRLDIYPGESSGYYAVYGSPRQSRILSNKYWRSGSQYVTVTAGQYLLLEDCWIQQ